MKWYRVYYKGGGYPDRIKAYKHGELHDGIVVFEIVNHLSLTLEGVEKVEAE